MGFIHFQIHSLIYFCETMKHQAAYSLLWLSGKTNITANDVETFMKACGVSCDKAELEVFIKAVGDRTIPDLVKAGSERTISMPCGGGGGGAAAAGGAGGAAEAPKEEEKKVEEEEVDMGGLFGDDDDY